MNPRRLESVGRHGLIALALVAASGHAVCWAQGAPPPGYVVIDPSAPGDAGQQIQDCVDSLPSMGGGVCDARGQRGGDIGAPVLLNKPDVRVILASGVYLVDGAAAFRVTADNVTLEGQGAATTITGDRTVGAGETPAGWPGTSPLIDVGGTTAVVDSTRLLDVQIVGEESSAATLVRLANVQGSRVAGLILTKGGASGMVVRDAENVDLSGNTIREFGRNGIRLDSQVTYARVRGNFIENVGILADTGTANTAGIIMWGLNGSAPRFVRITDNSIVDSANGIRALVAGGGVPSDYLIAGNTLVDSGSSASTQGEGITTAGRNVQIIANRIEGSRQDGVYVVGDHAENVSVVGNTISNASKLSSGHFNAIGLNPQASVNDIEQVLVAGNVAFDDQAIQTQEHLIGATLVNGNVLGIIDDLLVASNVGSGISAKAIQCELEPLAAQERNIPEAP